MPGDVSLFHLPANLINAEYLIFTNLPESINLLTHRCLENRGLEKEEDEGEEDGEEDGKCQLIYFFVLISASLYWIMSGGKWRGCGINIGRKGGRQIKRCINRQT